MWNDKVFEWEKKIILISNLKKLMVFFNLYILNLTAMNFVQMLKYGVARMHDLIQDIQYWKTFYLSGRLQKPVCVS